MARLQKIFETINSKLPSYNSAFTKVRGLAIPVDTILGGNLRFAKKIGFPIPIWLPDNLTTTSKDATIVNNFLLLNSPLTWATPGSMLRISKHFLVHVEDIASDGLRLNLTDTLVTNVSSGSDVELFASSIEVNGNYLTPPTSIIVVNSLYRIYVGDSIVYNSFEYVVSSLVFVGILPDGRFEYKLTLSEPIPDPLYDTRTDQLYLRAYPAYESGKVLIPTIPHINVADNDIGPFLYDRISGVFYTDDIVDEVDNVTLYDSSQVITNIINNCGKN